MAIGGWLEGLVPRTRKEGPVKVRLPYMIQDQLTAVRKGMKPDEGFEYQGDEHFLDGPVCERVAVIDFDEATQSLRPGVKFLSPPKGGGMGKYEVPKLGGQYDVSSRDFQNVSVFSTVLKTMRAFESSDVLGRKLSWAFDGPQLLIVPRAGEWANAFYERASRSLQFFYFTPRNGGGGDRRVYTSLSHDIVAHETAHAILDGIAPDLYGAVTPQAMALHEAVADLTALFTAIDSRALRYTVLDQAGGTIRGDTAFSRVAEEFARGLGERSGYLRRLNSMDKISMVSPYDPYALCEVLTGALYQVLVTAFEEQKTRLSGIGPGDPDPKRKRFSASGRALVNAARLVRRLAFRALDYLPPGEVSFADYGRAIYAADRAANKTHPAYRRLLAREFKQRGIIADIADLKPVPPPPGLAIPPVTQRTLIRSDWLAYDFVNANRKLLKIPPKIPFRVLPRLYVEKSTYVTGGVEKKFRECILKISWEHVEANKIGPGYPPKRVIMVGTTLVLDGDNGHVRALLTTDLNPAHRRARDVVLRELLDQELLAEPGAPPAFPDGPIAERDGEVLHLSGEACTIHLRPQGGIR